MTFYLRNVVKYYSEVGDIKTIIIRCLKANRKKIACLFSTIDHIFALHALIEIMKFEKRKLFCSCIDFSKAFDSVWRIGLWRKLLRNEINGNFFRVIHNMYQNIKSCVSVGAKINIYQWSSN